MKKLYLITGLLFIAGLCFAGRIQQHHMMIIGQEQGAAGCSISDDFSGGTGNWTAVNGTWAITAGQYGTSTANGYRRSNYTACAAGGADQYVRTDCIAPDSGGDYVGCVLRSGASGNCYAVYGTTGSVAWKVIADDGTSVEDVATGGQAWNSGDTLGFQVTGTGNSTEVKIWVNPDGAADSTPASWGAADVTYTTDPSSPVDSGDYVGALTYSTDADDAYIDNFYGGST